MWALDWPEYTAYDKASVEPETNRSAHPPFGRANTFYAKAYTYLESREAN